jgi:hypothetical protein
MGRNEGGGGSGYVQVVQRLSWRKDPAILQRMTQVENMALMGFSNVAIATALGVDEKTIRKDRARLQEIWQERIGAKMDAMRAEAVAQYQKIQREAWMAAASLKNNSANKVGYLNLAKRAQDSICKVQGLAIEQVIIDANVNTGARPEPAPTDTKAIIADPQARRLACQLYEQLLGGGRATLGAGQGSDGVGEADAGGAGEDGQQ